jgi:gamma-tubulin complex component 3
MRTSSRPTSALDELENAGPLPVVPDIHHVAELIDTRLSADEEGAQKSARFNNLFSRLVSQPVLDQKWGMLYFLLELSDMASPTEPSEPRHDGYGQPNGSPAFRDAFARPGLSRVPLNDPQSGRAPSSSAGGATRETRTAEGKTHTGDEQRARHGR